MKCSACGEENSPNARYCSYCGAKLTTAPAPEAEAKPPVAETPKAEAAPKAVSKIAFLSS